MIEKISLHDVLPRVFRGGEDESSAKNSQVWLCDLDFIRGNRYLIEAESGAGKSSLCSFLYGVRSDYEGRIEFDGQEIASFSANRWSDLRSHSLGYLPQDLRLFPELTVAENITLKNRLTDFKSMAEIAAMLEQLGLDNKIDAKTGLLSVGQQQRVAIVRSLCQPLDFLLIDEPVSHLDEQNNRAVARMISDELDRQGAGLIATSVGNKILIDNLNALKL
ncbi:MAG: ATP-binding cassette domain-containing protein [Lachnoclostridium sp.]|nr:ATP-binding cassette domain-containing protein [Lachnoclostridium sp.]